MHAAAFATDAEEGGIVGHVLFSEVQAGAGRGVGLAPVAVLPAHQRSGIGAALVLAGIEACRSAGYHYVVVLGEPAYYRRFGFRRALDFGLGNEYGAQDEFMVPELRTGALAGLRGVVSYCGEFAELG